MLEPFSPRRTLKRGAIIAAANWPTAVIQASTDAIFKVIVAVPVVGGILLAALVIGADPQMLMTLDVRDMATAVVGALVARPVTLAAFVAAVATAVAGSATVVCAVKAGTVATIVASERVAGLVEEPPFDVSNLSRIGMFSAESFGDAVRRFGSRFVRLGAGLLVAYGLIAAVFARVAIGGGWAWAPTAVATVLLVVVVSGVNLCYLLAQVAVVSDDCSAFAALRRTVALLGRAWRPVFRVFGLILGLVAGATVASLLATAALGLVGFVPLVWFAVLPLQLAAWVVRALVFQYIALGAVASYASVYRTTISQASAPAPEVSTVPVAPGAA